jgi:UrcA family protein
MKTKHFLLATMLMSSLIGGAQAAEPSVEVSQRVVSFADLNLTHGADAATLYRRIKAAAQEVCDTANSRTLDMVVRARHCTQQSIARAVTDVDAPELTRYDATRRAQPIAVAMR